MNRTITLIETISDFQTEDRVEFLNYQAEGKSINLVAYIKKGNDSIKVFTYQSFTEYFVLNQKDAIHQNINLNTYFSSLLLERFIKHHYLGMPLPKEELMFAFLGNGVSVCDRLRKEHGDYMEIAHIAVNREITFYNPVSDEGRTRIEKFAKEENITIKSQGISALCPAVNREVMNKTNRTQKEPDYFYRRHMGSFKLYRNNHDGTADKIDQSWDEETIRKKTYGLNGWDYKPKSELKQHV